MATLDLVLAAVLAISLLVGFWRGLTFEVLSLLAWGLAFIAAQWLGPWTAVRLPMGEASAAVRQAAGFGIVFVVMLFAGGLLAVGARKLMHSVGLSPMDRALGAAFGVARALVLLLAFAILVNLTSLKDSAWWKESTGAAVLTVALQGMKPVMPEQFGRYLP